MEKIIETHGYVVVLAGGGGTRLFPLSHPDCPKQFCQLDSDNTFIQATVKRFLDVGFMAHHVVVITTNDRQTELAKSQLLKLGVIEPNICQIEPTFGYAGAMTCAAHFVHSLDPKAVILNTPSDQYIVSDEKFKNTVVAAMQNAWEGRPTIVGVKVNDIVTVMGCGHAKYDNSDGSDTMLRLVTGFVEKPARKEADKLMRDNSSACNTGINCWRADTLLERVPGKPHKMETDELMTALGEIDVAIGKFQWYDCGTLKSLWEISEKTPNHKNANLGIKGKNIINRTNCRRSLFITIPGVDLFVANVHDAAVAINEIDGKIVIVGVQLEQSQTVRVLAEDFAKYRDILSKDFSVGARNNRVVMTNMSNLEVVGFVGVENYTVSAIKYPKDGRIVVTVGCDKV